MVRLLNLLNIYPVTYLHLFFHIHTHIYIYIYAIKKPFISESRIMLRTQKLQLVRILLSIANNDIYKERDYCF